MKHNRKSQSETFHGTLKQIRLVSTPLFLSRMEETGKIRSQELIINANGNVQYTGRLGNEEDVTLVKHLYIDKKAVSRLMNCFAGYFSSEDREQITATDTGSWELGLTNKKGKTYSFEGPLIEDPEYKGTGLSGLVRETLGMDDLYGFDGNSRNDVIEQFTADYVRRTEENGLYSEQLRIDRQSGTLQFIRKDRNGNRTGSTYEDPKGVKQLLDEIDDIKSYFPDELHENDPDDERCYKFEIRTRKNGTETLEGWWGNGELPALLDELAYDVNSFLDEHGRPEMLEPLYRYCFVEFKNNGKPYSYLCDDPAVGPGSHVVVPVGSSYYEKTVKVVDVKTYRESEVPYPVEETKSVIRLCTPEETAKYEEKHSDIEPYFIEKGTGFPLILLHGNGEDSTYFKNQIDEFSRYFHVYAPATRGHGKTPRGNKPFTIRQFASDLLCFMDEQKIEKAHLLGFSDGANIAMIFALRHPERVGRLILNGGNLNPQGVKPSVQIPIKIGYRIAQRFAQKSEKALYKAELLGLMVHDPDLRAQELAAIQVQTLVIAGTNDVIKESHTKQIAASIRDAELRFIKGNHFVAAQNPVPFNRAVIDFLNEPQAE